MGQEQTEIPPESATRHPLQVCRNHATIFNYFFQNKWALWYLKGDRNKEWEECLKQGNFKQKYAKTFIILKFLSLTRSMIAGRKCVLIQFM